MPSTKAIKQRIKSTKNTAQITKAMEMVSAAKMRRSQETAIAARPYALAALDLMKTLVRHGEQLPKFFEEREERTILYLIIASDKGLAGALNANVFRLFARECAAAHSRGVDVSAIAIGKKANDYCRASGTPILESFTGFNSVSAITEAVTVAERVLGAFTSDEYDAVYAVGTSFRTTLVQEAVVRKILPVTEQAVEESVRGILPERGRYSALSAGDTVIDDEDNFEYQFEPSPAEVLTTLIPQLVAFEVHHMILEANASEHSARMVAMKNASDNARELIGALTVAYNTARQAAITREIIEITAGAEALQNA